MKTPHFKQESRRGRRVPGSGGICGLAGDRQDGRFLVECKRTDAKSISLKHEWWNRIREEALLNNRTPAIEIELCGDHLFIVSEEEFDKLLEVR